MDPKMLQAFQDAMEFCAKVRPTINQLIEEPDTILSPGALTLIVATTVLSIIAGPLPEEIEESLRRAFDLWCKANAEMRREWEIGMRAQKEDTAEMKVIGDAIRSMFKDFDGLPSN